MAAKGESMFSKIFAAARLLELPAQVARASVTSAIVALTVVTMTNSAAAKTVFPIHGDRGDAGFEDHCPANQFMIGLAGRAGSFIDQVRIICSPIEADGTQGSRYYGPSHGGNGGAPLEFSCPPSLFISRAYYLILHSADVSDVELTCTSLRSQTQSTVSFRGDSYSDGAAYIDQCPSNELASGLAGRYGKDVNAMGLFCDAPAAAAPPPDRSALPIRTTGSTPRLCPQGYVWREASPNDHVCVTPADRTLTRQENAEGATHVSQTDQTYGPNTCVQGYVWRAAYPGDAVCVTPAQRDAAAAQNAAAPAQVPK